MSLLILADDLTGAADCAARCRGAGLPAAIVLRPPMSPVPPGVMAFTSDSRHLPPTAAAARVHELAASLRDPAGATWYKKIDSTLRGNLGAELDAMLSALGRECALICPAFPSQGRGLRDGQLYSPALAAPPAHLPTLLRQQSARVVESIALESVRRGASQLAEQLAAGRRQAQLLVVDALTNQDLQIILAAAKQALPDALLCGSAGLAGTLAADPPFRAAPRDTEEAALPHAARALLVVGSGSAAARRQVAHLRQHQRVETIEVDPTDERRKTNDERRKTAADETAGGSRLAAGGDVLLHLPEPRTGAALDGPEARALAAALATTALPLIARLRPELLALVGGDTAFHVLDRLGVERLTVLRELLPGIPLARGVAADGSCLLVILKPGNFGEDETLATLLRQARKEE